MDAHETTIRNADLWSRYFQDQWGRMLNPLGVPAESPVTQIAEGTAARVANVLTLIAAGPIAWLYQSNNVPADPSRAIDDAIVGDGLALRLAPDLESVEDPAA
jgi:hypothetical protein